MEMVKKKKKTIKFDSLKTILKFNTVQIQDAIRDADGLPKVVAYLEDCVANDQPELRKVLVGLVFVLARGNGKELIF